MIKNTGVAKREKINDESYDFVVSKPSVGEMRFNPDPFNRREDSIIAKKITVTTNTIISRVRQEIPNKHFKKDLFNFLLDLLITGLIIVSISVASFWLAQWGSVLIILYLFFLYFSSIYDSIEGLVGPRVLTSKEEIVKFQANGRVFQAFLKKIPAKEHGLLTIKISELKDSGVDLSLWFKTAEKLLTLTPNLTVDLLPTDINTLEELVLKAEEKKIELDKIKREKELLEKEAVEEGERVKRELLTEQNKQLKLEILNHINELD